MCSSLVSVGPQPGRFHTQEEQTDMETRLLNFDVLRSVCWEPKDFDLSDSWLVHITISDVLRACVTLFSPLMNILSQSFLQIISLCNDELTKEDNPD